MTRQTLAWLVQPELTEIMLGARERALLEAMTDVIWWEGAAPPTGPEAADLLRAADLAVFSWGAPKLTEEVLGNAARLRRVHYAAGSVKPLVHPAIWARQIRLTSAAAAIAENVAEYTLGLMILGLYNHWGLTEETRAGRWERSAGALGMPRALIGSTIGILGAGQVGRRVMRLLQNFPVRVLLYDPFITQGEARELGGEKVDLETLLCQADVVTLHVPNLPETYHLLNAERFALMRDDAVLINTARGASIDEDALVTELRKGRFFALLDVTDPEPPAVDHPFRTLPNVRLTPHVAGGINNGRLQIGRLVLSEIEQSVTGGEPLHEVTEEMLSTIA